MTDTMAFQAFDAYLALIYREGLFLVLQSQSKLSFALVHGGKQMMAAPRTDRDGQGSSENFKATKQRKLSYLCARFRDVAPWYFAVDIRAFCRNFRENPSSLRP